MADVTGPVVRRGVGALPWLLRALGEPTRQEVYREVRRAARPVTRVEIAERVQIARRLAAFHLDRLVEEGLLDVHYARPPDRPGGPGAGRPAKWYRPSGIQVDVTIPERRTDLAARVLAVAMEQLGPTGRHRDALRTQARACGRALADAGSRDDLLERLATIGYEPARQPDGVVQMRNCPFRPVVNVARDTTCAMNVELVAGLSEAHGQRYVAVLAPAEDRCCVLLRPVD